jgi:hypothetical protein
MDYRLSLHSYSFGAILNDELTWFEFGHWHELQTRASKVLILAKRTIEGFFNPFWSVGSK